MAKITVTPTCPRGKHELKSFEVEDDEDVTEEMVACRECAADDEVAAATKSAPKSKGRR